LADASVASTSVTLRGAYLAHLDDAGTAAVGGTPAPVDGLLRSAYAARLAGAARGPQPGRLPRVRAARKAQPAQRAAASARAKAAKKAAARPRARAKAKAKATRTPAARRGRAKPARRRR